MIKRHMYLTNNGLSCLTNADCPLGDCVGSCDEGTLGSMPFYKLSSQWGTAKVRGREIRPGTAYRVQTQTDVAGGSTLSSAATAATWKWCDVDDNGIVNVIDVANLVNALKGSWGPFTFEQMNLYGCEPDAVFNALDIVLAVDAVRGFPFPCDPATCGTSNFPPPNPYYFTGRRLDFDLRDANGQPLLALYDYRAREYDARHGRFLQRDPAGYVDGANLYEAFKSNPQKYVDPSGRGVLTYLLEGRWNISDWQYASTFFGSLGQDAANTAMTVVGGTHALITSRDARTEFLITYDETVIQPTAERALNKHQTLNPDAEAAPGYPALGYELLKDVVGADPLAEGVFSVDLGSQERLSSEEALQRTLAGSAGIVLTTVSLQAGITCKAGKSASIEKPLPVLGADFRPTTGILRIAEAYDVAQTIATQAQTTVGGAGRVAAILKHTAARNMVRSLGRADLLAEESYLGGQPLPGGYGTPGSVRADLVLGNTKSPLVVFDFKFGKQGLTPGRLQQLQQNLPEGVRIIVVRPLP